MQIGISYRWLRAPSIDVQFLANYLVAPAAHNASLAQEYLSGLARSGWRVFRVVESVPRIFQIRGRS
jgi:hypothetical protein